MNKILAVILCAAALLCFWKLVPYTDIPTLAGEIEHPYAASIVQQEGANRDRLSDENKELYDVIKTGLLNCDAEILVRRFAYGEEDIRDVLWSIMSDSPELFYVDWSWDVRSQDNGFVILPRYLFDASEKDARVAEFNAAVDSVVLLAEQAGVQSDYDKVLFVHDYLIQNCKYNEQAGDLIHTAYGALVSKEAVCDGYAQAAHILLDRLGVDCYYVEGTTTPSATDEGHAWNIVTVDGANYHLDVTWDDRDAEHVDDSYDNIVSYNYFLISDEDMAIDHTVTNKLPLPACPNGYGYFKKLGLEGNLFEDIYDTMLDTVVANVDRDVYFIEFRIANDEDYMRIVQDANTEGGIGELIGQVNEELEYKGYWTRFGDTYSIYRSDERNSALVVFTLE